MNIKHLLLQSLPKLPNAVNSALLKLNPSGKAVFGRRYGAYCDFLASNRESFDNRGLLLESVNRAIAEVDFYRHLYGARQLKSIEEFENTVQTVDKDTVLNNFEAFTNKTVELSAYDRVTTGGTSGRPLQLIVPQDRFVVELATMHSLWSNAGYRFHLRGVIRNQRLSSERTYLVNPITKEYIFDGFTLTDEYFHRVYGILHNHRIEFIHCYPSMAYEFSRFLQREGLDCSFIRAFLSGSENVYDYQVDLIERELRIRFYNWYGHSEKLLLGGYCPGNRLYHMEPTYGYFELLDEKGEVIREPGGFGELVGTSFHNPGMPLIRYRTGDYAELYGFQCPDCGRRLPLLKSIQGRWSGERVYNKDGSFVTTTALNLHGDLYRHLNGLQYVQEEMGFLKVLVVKGETFGTKEHEDLRQHFRSKMKDDTVIQIDYVDRLIRKPNGKFVVLLSSLEQLQS